ncbi:MAG TPA: hypothetical protein VGN72_10260 [Tepidisphaeraceae bacterium]|jgi:hypothetical protein|nr:hypothetical protein [Tepidisphaeraceae bacterium]
MSETLFQLVQIAYWLSLSTWFGAVLFIAIAAPTIFKTVTDYKPILPTVLSVNLENQHATLLAGSIVGDLVARLSRVQLACAAVLGLTLLLQAFMIDLRSGPDAFRSNFGAFALRVMLFFGATAVMLYDWRIHWPRVLAHRERYIDNADDPDIANPAKDDFDREGRRTVTLLMAVVGMLLGMIVFSGNIMPKAGTGGDVPTMPAPVVSKS